MEMLCQIKEELEGWRRGSRAFADEDSKLEHKKVKIARSQLDFLSE